MIRKMSHMLQKFETLICSKSLECDQSYKIWRLRLIFAENFFWGPWAWPKARPVHLLCREPDELLDLRSLSLLRSLRILDQWLPNAFASSSSFSGVSRPTWNLSCCHRPENTNELLRLWTSKDARVVNYEVLEIRLNLESALPKLYLDLMLCWSGNGGDH